METIKSQCYCSNFRRDAGVISEIYDEMLKESGLRSTQFHLLMNLSEMQQANITHWADKVGLDRSTMVRNIKVLEKNNLVIQVEGHGKVYALSETGKKQLTAAVRLWDVAQKKMEEILGPEDAEAFFRISRKIQEYWYVE